jgi:hypothetical protein
MARNEDALAYATDSDPDSDVSSHVSPITPHLYSSAAGFFGVEECGDVGGSVRLLFEFLCCNSH